MQIPVIGAGLLVVGGIINAVPPISGKLSEVMGGKPVIQVLIGIGSFIIGLVMFAQTV